MSFPYKEKIYKYVYWHNYQQSNENLHVNKIE